LCKGRFTGLNTRLCEPGRILYLVLIYETFMKRYAAFLLLCMIWLPACKKSNTNLDNTCPYVLYTPSGGGCQAGQVQVSGSGCCPENKPFACGNVCYASCEEAYASCGSNVIKGQAAAPGNAQLSGVWKRNTLSDPCQDLTVFYDGTEGRVSASGASCCYMVNEMVWQNYSGDYIQVKDCSGNFQTSLLTFSDNNSVTVGGIPYQRQ